MHEFRLCGTAAADSSTCSGQSSLCTEEEEETSTSQWQVDEEFSPEAHQSRRAPVNYEGDDETSMAELTYKTKKSSTENGNRDQQKVIFLSQGFAYRCTRVIGYHVGLVTSPLF